MVQNIFWIDMIMAAVASEGIPEIITNMRVEQVTTLEDTTKSDYFD